MQEFVVRRNCEYSTVIEAEDADEAYAIASNQDAHDWQTAWSDIEVED